MKYRTKYLPSHPNASSSGCVPVHVLIAESALGRCLPKGAEVHHVDGDPRNNRNGNLVICEDRAFHKLLHVRTRVLQAGGDPNTQRICATCKRLLFFWNFHRRAANQSGLQSQCKECTYTVSRLRRELAEAY